MSPVSVILAILAYMALLLGVSHLASRRGSRAADFFNGGRRMPWFVVGFAMIGAAISGVTFISVPGMVVAKGYTYLQMVLGFIVGYLVIAAVLVPLFYRRNLLSIYGWLEERFGKSVRRTGAWFFFVSKILGASVRFYVVCAVLQPLVFAPLGIPFAVNVAATVALVWLYTFRSGVRSLIFTDLLKSFCLVMSAVLAIWFIAREMGLGLEGIVESVVSHPTAEVFNFADPMSATYFWKQFVAGVFMAIAMNGLDQDMMQRHLSCRDSRSSRKNMIFSGVMQFFVIALFLMLGTALVIYADHASIAIPERTDELFGLVATHPTMPAALGLLFVVGLVSAAYSAAGSALTSLTTSFTIDILDGQTRMAPERLDRTRRGVHVAMAVAMALVIIVFNSLSSDDAISAVYTLASYTYGPLLGLFTFGLATGVRPQAALSAAACVAAPLLSWLLTRWLLDAFGYHTGFELLLINAALTMAGLGLACLAAPSRQPLETSTENGTESI